MVYSVWPFWFEYFIFLKQISSTQLSNNSSCVADFHSLAVVGYRVISGLTGRQKDLFLPARHHFKKLKQVFSYFEDLTSVCLVPVLSEQVLKQVGTTVTSEKRQFSHNCYFSLYTCSEKTSCTMHMATRKHKC